MELYSPDQWTPTSAHLLATVADDTDLYLQKVDTLLRHCRDPGCIHHFRCPATVATFPTRCLPASTWATSESGWSHSVY